MKYHLYRNSFPVLALSSYLKTKRRKRSETDHESSAFAQVADMATYIAKNKIRPRPEWQKNVAATRGPSNPFKIIHTQIPSAQASASRIR